MKRIGFVSTRISGTDGVTLETYKWYQVLERNGYECYFFAGELDVPPERSFLEPKAHFEHPEILDLHRSCFGTLRREPHLTKHIQGLRDHLKSKLRKFCEEFGIEMLIPENALAIPMNIPLGMAITEFLAETCMPAIAHHHDFSWERKRFLINAVQDYLQYAFPPILRCIRHVVINSEASRQLSYRKGISNVIIHNVFDFKNPPPASNSKSRMLRKELGFSDKDLFILQPTRIVPRKWIERAVELASLLGMEHPRVVIPHESGDEGDLYALRVLEYAKRLGVEVLYIGDQVGSIHGFSTECNKKYTIDDVYQAADIVTYPSGYEGFGNAFVEAIYFKKPIVVNRYSIFVEDIETCGFDVVDFESFVTRQLAERLRKFMEPDNMRASVEKNYQLGREFFSYEVLERKLLSTVSSFS
jgi:glycosyltransferase involved in cell wall biosynthesis